MNSLRITTKIDEGGFRAGLQNMEKSIDRFAGRVVGSSRKMDGAWGEKQQKNLDMLQQRFARQNEAVQKQGAYLDGLKKKYDALASGEADPKALKTIAREIAELEKRIAPVDAQLEKLAEMQNININLGAPNAELDAQMERLGKSVEEDNARLETLRSQLADVQMNPQASEEAQALAQQIELGAQKFERLKNEAGYADAAVKKALGAKEAAAKQGVEGLSDEFTKIPPIAARAEMSVRKALGAGGGAGGGAGKFSGVLKNILSMAGRIPAALGRIPKAARPMGSAFDGIGKKVDQFKKRVTNLAMSVFVFQLFRKGLNALRDHVGGLLSKNKEFMTSLGQVKANLAGAFQPIYNAILPAINAMMSALAKATAYLSAFISMIFGSSKAANGNTKALNATAGAAGSVAKETKKAAGELAKFDDIQVLEKPEPETGGGGGGGGAPIALDEPEMELAGWLKDMEDALLAQDWFRMGEIVATEINNAIAKIPWGSIGANIGGFLQGAFTLAFGFLETIDTQQIGTGLGSLFNNIVATLNPTTVGNTFASFWNRAVDFFYGIVTETNWAAIGVWIANAVIGFFEKFDLDKLFKSITTLVNGMFAMLKNCVLTIPWGTAGKSLATSLNAAIGDIDGETFAEGVSGLINGLVLEIHTFVTTFDWKATATKFAGWISSVITGIDWATLGTTLSEGLGGLLDFCVTGITETDWQALGDGIWTAIKNIDWLGLLGKLGQLCVGLLEGLGQLLVAPFAEFGTWIADKIGGLFGKKGSAVNERGLGGGRGHYFGEEMMDGAKKGIEENSGAPVLAADTAADAAAKAFNDRLAAIDAGESAKGMMASVKESVEESTPEVVATFESVYAGIEAAQRQSLQASEEYQQGLAEALKSGAVKTEEEYLRALYNVDELARQTFADMTAEAANFDLAGFVAEWDGSFESVAKAGLTASERQALYYQLLAENGAGAAGKQRDDFEAMYGYLITASDEAFTALTGDMDGMKDQPGDIKENAVDPTVESLGTVPAAADAAAAETVQTLGGVTDAAAGMAGDIKTTVTDPIQADFGEMGKGVVSTMTTTAGGVTTAFSTTAAELTTKTLAPTEKAFDTTGAKVVTTMQEAETGTEKAWEETANWFKLTVTSPVADLFTDLRGKIETNMRTAYTNMKSTWLTAESWFKTSVTNPIDSLFAALGTSIVQTMESALVDVVRAVNKAITGMETATNTALAAIRALYMTTPDNKKTYFTTSMNTVSFPRIPYLAQGAVIPPRQEFMAVLGDQRSGTNIEAPADLIRQIVREELNAGGGILGQQEVVVRFDVDAAGLVRYLRPYQVQEGRRIGGSMVTGGDFA